ncbi:UNVERIFIED_CONTAM: hypothetical protein RF648_20780, partial [Kocuria sp. CPCC 205274]
MQLIKNEDGTFDINVDIEELAIIKTWSLMDANGWEANFEHMLNIGDPHIMELVHNGFGRVNGKVDHAALYAAQNSLFRDMDKNVKKVH